LQRNKSELTATDPNFSELRLKERLLRQPATQPFTYFLFFLSAFLFFSPKVRILQVQSGKATTIARSRGKRKKK
jgi:hypothetical protein